MAPRAARRALVRPLKGGMTGHPWGPSIPNFNVVPRIVSEIWAKMAKFIFFTVLQSRKKKPSQVATKLIYCHKNAKIEAKSLSILGVAPLLVYHCLHAARHRLVEVFQVLWNDTSPDLSCDFFQSCHGSCKFAFLLITSRRIELESCSTSQIKENCMAILNLS